MRKNRCGSGEEGGSTLHRAPVGQGPLGPGWLAIALGFWSGRALATDTAWAGSCLIHHHHHRRRRRKTRGHARGTFSGYWPTTTCARHASAKCTVETRGRGRERGPPPPRAHPEPPHYDPHCSPARRVCRTATHARDAPPRARRFRRGATRTRGGGGGSLQRAERKERQRPTRLRVILHTTRIPRACSAAAARASRRSTRPRPRPRRGAGAARASPTWTTTTDRWRETETRTLT